MEIAHDQIYLEQCSFK